MLVLHNSIQLLNIRCLGVKDKPPKPRRAGKSQRWYDRNSREQNAATGARAASSTRLLEVRNQHDIAIAISARKGKLLAVLRPGEVKDQGSFEVRQLFRRSSGERLFP